MKLHLILLFYGLSAFAVVECKKVVGLIFTSCHEDQSTLHTAINSPLFPPHDQTTTRMAWLSDHQSTHLCSPSLQQVLTYCRKIYNDDESNLVVDQATSDSVNLSVRNLFLPVEAEKLDDSQLFWCLGPESTIPDELPVDDYRSLFSGIQSKQSHEPSLIDIHRAYFAERVRDLFKQTNASVLYVVDQLVRQATGLRKLHRTDDPEVARAAMSHSLQTAYKDLLQLWTAEELNKFKFERSEHEDLVKELDAEDWASENEFTYVLQEPSPNLDRVQDALSRLLQSLTNSVEEEVRFLRQVQANQPWALHMEANWTSHMTQGVTDLGRIHNTLLKYVRTATIAINTLRSLVAKQGVAKVHYKVQLRNNYDRLQATLTTAQQVLNEAKSMLIHNLTSRMHSIVGRLQNGSLPTEDTASFEQWVESRHHEELARIDLLVLQILGLTQSPYDDWTFSKRAGLRFLPRFFSVFSVVLVITFCISLLVSCCCVYIARRYNRRQQTHNNPNGRYAAGLMNSFGRYWSKRGNKLVHVLIQPMENLKQNRQDVQQAEQQQRVANVNEACGVPLLLSSSTKQNGEDMITLPYNMDDQGYMNPVYSVVQHRH